MKTFGIRPDYQDPRDTLRRAFMGNENFERWRRATSVLREVMGDTLAFRLVTRVVVSKPFDISGQIDELEKLADELKAKT
jgi:hypothetical protein